MIWLEMARDPVHGGYSWSFGCSLWSPAYKKGNAGRWAYWDNLLRVKADHQIIHLRGIGDKAAFTGFSTADTDGFQTDLRPPAPRQWAYGHKISSCST